MRIVLLLAVPALLAALSGCSVVSSRDNVAQAATLSQRQSVPDAPWRRDEAGESAARERVQQLLRDGITAPESIAICFLAHPEVQLAFEALEVSRSELVAAVTPPNPVAVVGTRTPGGNLSAFYPERSVTVGVLQNVLALVNLPARRRIATLELARARIETADRLVALASEVNEAYITYAAALRIDALRQEAAMNARATLELLRQQAERAPDGGEAALLGEQATMLQVEGNALRSALDAATARERLAQLMGIAGRHDDWHVADELPPLPPADPAPRELETRALEQRLDLAAARTAVEARLDAAGVQKRWRWLGAAEVGVFRESASGGTRFTGPNALVELPLFDQRQAQILATSAEARAAARRLESLFLAARAEIRTHGAEVAATRALLVRYDTDLLPALRRLRTLGGEGIEARRAGFAEIAAQEERVGLLRDYWRARGALARAAGDWAALPDWPRVSGSGASGR